ncbi:hypothetical protein [Nocardiopsis algeriensis]|uniref:Uncharacterized protein n=1 Tax=Nocardiopsis algeriensis TaxID=1478215 RepID=A0A841IPC4_9ACTN|nr:hypothetical protein [Nocardiopsis algeriensis]MBB6120040.1 hypothetical protein [Nocardiopsis algeriensis]
MAVPAVELSEADPRRLGGFRLEGRLRESALGVVYLGRDRSGKPVGIAVLNAGATADEQARRCFAEAVRSGPGVLAARTHGRSVLWVAVGGDDSGAAAQEFLERAGRSGRAAAGAPVVAPYWAGERTGPMVRWAPWAGRRDSAVAEGRGNWWLIGGLGLVLALLLLLVSALYWLMLQFPPPEQMPSPGEPPPQGEQSEGTGEESEPAEGDGEGDTPSTPVLPSPGEGDGEWQDEPEDNL